VKVELTWITPNAEQMIVDIARVSTNKPPGEPGERLLSYLIKHKHWSPFEMANMCVYIETTRDISHQLIRHRSFSFQEFSQRYSEVIDKPVYRVARMQHPTNRQLSVPSDTKITNKNWLFAQEQVYERVTNMYKWALETGIAKEVARTILPEGMTPTRLYMNGNIRSWLHFVEARTYEGAQLEIRLIANEIERLLEENLPTVYRAFKPDA
jgi:thymidylate synthase (FAD)